MEIKCRPRIWGLPPLLEGWVWSSRHVEHWNTVGLVPKARIQQETELLATDRSSADIPPDGAKWNRNARFESKLQLAWREREGKTTSFCLFWDRMWKRCLTLCSPPSPTIHLHMKSCDQYWLTVFRSKVLPSFVSCEIRRGPASLPCGKC